MTWPTWAAMSLHTGCCDNTQGVVARGTPSHGLVVARPRKGSWRVAICPCPGVIAVAHKGGNTDPFAPITEMEVQRRNPRTRPVDCGSCPVAVVRDRNRSCSSRRAEKFYLFISASHHHQTRAFRVLVPTLEALHYKLQPPGPRLIRCTRAVSDSIGSAFCVVVWFVKSLLRTEHGHHGGVVQRRGATVDRQAKEQVFPRCKL